MRQLHRLAVIAALAIALLGRPAAAQSPQEVVEQATAAFQAGEYESAVSLFQQAFDLDPHPVIMFNLARAYQEMGDLPNALLHFKNIRTLDAPAHVLEAAETKIAEVEEALIAQGYDPLAVTSSDYVPRGELTVTTQPEGADVFLDGEYRGQTPFRVRLMDAGVYALRLELDGYHPVTQDIEVHGQRPNLRSFNLTPRTTLDEYVPPSPGYLSVRAPVSGLDVFIDGEFAGYTPLIAERLAPGTYLVTIRGSDWNPYNAEVEVGSGEESELIARMQPVNTQDVTDPNRRRRQAGTALMISGGAVVAGGVAMGVLALGAASDYRDDASAPDRSDLRQRAKGLALGADIGFIGGAALLTTGAILHYVLGTPADDIDSDLLVRPTTGPGLGFGLNARW